MTRILAIFLIPLLVGACQKSTTLTADDKARITRDIKQMLDNYYNDIREAGLMAEFSYLDNSADFFWVPPGFAGAISYDSVASILRRDAPTLKTVDNTFEVLQILPLNEEYATYTGRLTSRVTDATGTVNTYKLVETGVIVKSKGGWKLLAGQTSML